MIANPSALPFTRPVRTPSTRLPATRGGCTPNRWLARSSGPPSPPLLPRETTVSAGALQVSNSSGSATGVGPVGVGAGTMPGGGIITGPLSVGIGSGTGAFLAPGRGAKTPATLTAVNALTFEADGVYICKLSKQKVKADRVVANGVTIETGRNSTSPLWARTDLPAARSLPSSATPARPRSAAPSRTCQMAPPSPRDGTSCS